MRRKGAKVLLESPVQWFSCSRVCSQWVAVNGQLANWAMVYGPMSIAGGGGGVGM
jgi:hypothetical protein